MQAATLKGKTALVTGSTSGIGLAIARAMASEGANVLFNGFGDPKEIEGLQADVARTHGVKTAYDPADLSRRADIESMMRFAIETFGGIDVLVNNAGIQHVANIEEFPPDLDRQPQ